MLTYADVCMLQSGMLVAESCMACRRSSDGLSQGQWGTVTGNLPFDKASDDNSSNSTSLNNFFSIRVSRPPVVGLEHGDQFPLFVGVLLAFVLF
jgi:hypothetical protein